MSKSVSLLLIVLAALLLAGCGANVNVNFNAEGGATITVSLDQARIDELIRESPTATDRDGLLTEITSVDLMDGLVRVTGVHVREDGTRLNGSYDFTMSANDGRLSAQVVAVNIEGFNMDDARIARINQELADAFSRAASDSPNVHFDSVVISIREFKISLTVTR
jgi:hypothetical protein